MRILDTTPGRRRALLVALLVAILAAAYAAPHASAAAQRYAGPTGTGTGCTSAQPCAFGEAVGGANPGDDVIVTAGDYQLTETISAPHPITIRGVAGQPRPRLRFSGAGQKGLRMDWGGTLRGVKIDQAAERGALFVRGGSVDRVVAQASGTGVATATVHDSSVFNSIFTVSGSTAICAGRRLLSDGPGSPVSPKRRDSP
jgi:hypothetical protein